MALAHVLSFFDCFFSPSPPVKNSMWETAARARKPDRKSRVCLDQPTSKAVHISHPCCLQNHVPARPISSSFLILFLTYPTMTLARILLRSTLRSRTSHYTSTTRPLLVRCSSSQFHSSAFLEKASIVEWGYGSKEMNIFESDSVIPQVTIAFSSHSLQQQDGRVRCLSVSYSGIGTYPNSSFALVLM